MTLSARRAALKALGDIGKDRNRRTADLVLQRPVAPVLRLFIDIAHQLALLRHLRRAAQGGAGVVLVLHDLAHAMNHADRVVVLDRGVVAADGACEDALDQQVIERYDRLLVHYGRRALSCADGGICRVCGMRVTVQDIQIIKMQAEDSVVPCKSCGRILYLEEEMRGTLVKK